MTEKLSWAVRGSVGAYPLASLSLPYQARKL